MKRVKNFYLAMWSRNLWFVSWQEIKLQIGKRIKFPLTKKAYLAEHWFSGFLYKRKFI